MSEQMLVICYQPYVHPLTWVRLSPHDSDSWYAKASQIKTHNKQEKRTIDIHIKTLRLATSVNDTINSRLYLVMYTADTKNTGSDLVMRIHGPPSILYANNKSL